MRRRLINSTLAVVLVVIAVFGVSLVIIESRTIEGSAEESVRSDAARLVSVVESRIVARESVTAESMRSHVPEDRHVRIELPGQAPIELGERPDDAIEGRASSGPNGVTVTVRQDRATVREEVGRTLLIILAVALLAVIAAVLLAVGQARRVAAPLTDLAETAERLGSGDPRPRHRRYGVPELDRVADVLDASAERIARMLTAERRLAADASHQLRTPLTALSMRLEEIVTAADSIGAADTSPTADRTATAGIREEAMIGLAQVERLTDVVQRLLTNSRDPRSGSAVGFDLDEVVKQQVEEWRPAYRKAGRAIVRSGREGLRAVGTPGAVAQVLATLVENALMHGAGAVALRTRIAGNQVVVEVTDEGPGVDSALGSRVFERTVSGRNSTGLGLAVARDLAEADGGRLELLQQHPPVFALFLSREVAEEPSGD
ncbi:HAMP domain-containing protein [Streptomyces sp. TRM43335]|uniref:Signal transduction histidine-protein kinase/phosphatase MprB n=1 Tax=Streptomyces taklimakanensis TaxID=2569853 RepID=A0A6G2BAN3_9ACTN|nr:ATP-binding protein [Streptomyces taklimakanensis]MTE19327.1 HAMP domain-containing protein [Streptomyces taklimakanensis]